MKREPGNLKFLTTVLGLFLLASHTFAADVRMTIEPQLISLLDRAILKIEFIDTKGDAVNIPEVEGLRIEYKGQSSETRIINMKSSSRVIHNYLVTPSKAGDFTIGPITCSYSGGEKDISAQLRVIRPEDDKEAQEISQIMFSRISTNRKNPFVHEPFDLDLKVYIRDGVQIDGSFSLRGGIPESGMEGELNWDVIDKAREVRDETIFNVYTLHTTARTLTAGTFSFRPEVQLNVVIPRQNRRPYGFDDPFFGDFFGRQETRPIVLDCNTLEVTVQSVPTDRRPESYTGGVGIFDFDVEVGPEQIMAGDPVTVKMKITGDGNIKQITPPAIEGGHELKLYEARTLPSEKKDEVVFEQVVIPTTETATNIPSISFSYFNTKTADFRTISRGPFPIQVDPRPQRAAQVIATVPSTIRKETEILGRDIVYLKSLPAHWKTAGRTPWHQTRLFILLLILPAALLTATIIITARRNRLASNVALARRYQAPKAARRNLRLAERAMRRHDGTAFYESLWKTLIDYFGHRLNLAPGDVTLQAVMTRIPEESEAIGPLFSTVEQRRYGFNHEEDSKTEQKVLLKQTHAVLRKCERKKL